MSHSRQYEDETLVIATAVAEPVVVPRDLPSNLSYKGLGRELDSVFADTPPQVQHAQVLPVNDLPSDLEYKDQGRELNSVVSPPTQQDPAVAPGAQEPDLETRGCQPSDLPRNLWSLVDCWIGTSMIDRRRRKKRRTSCRK
jgi:hypothetical protein